MAGVPSRTCRGVSRDRLLPFTGARRSGELAEAIEEQISGLNMYRSDARDFIRLIMMWADEVTLDSQGRITLPKPLMEFAGLDGRATILGAFDHIEIWDPERFQGYLNEQTEDYETLAERVMGV